MDTRAGTGPLVVIVGETASGKSALALDLAERFNGEIICADSRTIYKGMEIGTAKPSLAERQRIRHHILDVVDPTQSFSAADYQRLAYKAIQDITTRGKLPIMVGGSGLYIDAVLFDYQFANPPDPKERQRLQGLTVEQLQQSLKKANIPLPANSKNLRHLIRALEIGGINQNKKSLRPNTLLIGLKIPPDVLRERIIKRVDEMLERGFVEEVERLGERYGWDGKALLAPGYRAFQKFIKGGISLEQARQSFIKNDIQLAKRQRTWFKRNNSIHWIDHPSKAVDIVTTFLNK